MKSQGFENVFQLKGGILKYLEDVDKKNSFWEGECFVFDNRIFSYIDDIPETTMLEGKPLERLASDNELMAYRHDGYWHCIDTLRDLEQANLDAQSDKNWFTWTK